MIILQADSSLLCIFHVSPLSKQMDFFSSFDVIMIDNDVEFRYNSINYIIDSLSEEIG